MYCVCLGAVKYIMQMQMSDGNKGKDYYCAKVMQTKFVEVRPLFSRIFHEKVSNFRTMFRSVLSEKFTIFLENSR